MSILNGLMGNKTLINAALSSVRTSMKKDGISCIVLKLTDEEGGDTPGLDVKSYDTEIGILSGEDLKLANRLYDTDPTTMHGMLSTMFHEAWFEDYPATWKGFFSAYDAFRTAKNESLELDFTKGEGGTDGF